MDTIHSDHADPVASTLCPNCGKPLRFVRSLPRLGGLPELHTFECKACGITYTEAEDVESEDLAGDGEFARFGRACCCA